MKRQSRTKPCVFRLDADVPPATDPRRPEAPGVPFCRCGLRQDHPRHQLPDVPEQAVVAGRYERGEAEA